MALVYGPTIPGYTNGLTFYIDAVKPQSYPGSGTTWYNMINEAPNCALANSPTFNNTPPSTNFTFDGSNDYVNIPGGTSAITLGNGNLAWTVSVWIKTTTAVNGLGQGSILSNSSGGPVYSMMGVNAGTIVYWTYQNDAWAQKLGSATVNNNIWHMLTWVNYTNYTMDMYVDGVLDANVANSTSGNNNPVDTIAGSWAGVYAGSIATLSIYKGTALTASQVSQNYNALKSRFGL
jgi:hypothetical protein